MAASNPLKTFAEWANYEASLARQYSWREDAAPDHFPCVAVHWLDYDDRRGSYKLCYEFVYLDDFDRHGADPVRESLTETCRRALAAIEPGADDGNPLVAELKAAVALGEGTS